MEPCSIEDSILIGKGLVVVVDDNEGFCMLFILCICFEFVEEQMKSMISF